VRCPRGRAWGPEGREREASTVAPVVVVYLGHGEVAEDGGGVHALLARYRGWWREGRVAWFFWRGTGSFYRREGGVRWTGSTDGVHGAAARYSSNYTSAVDKIGRGCDEQGSRAF